MCGELNTAACETQALRLWRHAAKQRNADAALKADKDVVLAAVAQDGLALEYASAALQADRDVVLAAVAQSGWGLQYASAALKADRDVVLAAVTQEGYALAYASAAPINDAAFLQPSVAPINEAFKPMVRGARP